METNLIEIQEQVNPVLREVKKLVVKNEEGMKRAIDILAMLKNRMTFVEAKRKEYTQPLNQSIRKINVDFKTVTEPIREARERVESAMRDYRAIIAEKQAEARIKAQKTGKVKPVAQQTTSSDRGSIRVKMVPKFNVVDINKIPREYLKIDEVAINRALRSGVRQIEGLDIFEEEEISSYN